MTHRNEAVTYRELFQRMGGVNVVAQGRWLLDFAQRDLTAISADEFASLCEVLPIIGPWNSKDVQRVANKPAPHIDWLAPYHLSGLAKQTGLSLEQALKDEAAMKESGQWAVHERRILYEMFQEPVAQLFRGLLSSGKPTTEDITLRLQLRKGAKIPDSISDQERPHQLFIYRAAFIIQGVADHLTHCADPQCHRGPRGGRQAFIQSRTDQEFCSDACGSRVRMERKRRIPKQKKAAATTKKKLQKGRTTHTKGGKSHGATRRKRPRHR